MIGKRAGVSYSQGRRNLRGMTKKGKRMGKRAEVNENSDHEWGMSDSREKKRAKEVT